MPAQSVRSQRNPPHFVIGTVAHLL